MHHSTSIRHRCQRPLPLAPWLRAAAEEQSLLWLCLPVAASTCPKGLPHINISKSRALAYSPHIRVHKGPYDVLRDQKLLIQFQARSAQSSLALPVSARLASQKASNASDATGRRLHRDIAAGVRVEGMLPICGGAEPRRRPAAWWKSQTCRGWWAQIHSSSCTTYNSHTTLYPITNDVGLASAYSCLVRRETKESFGISSATLTHTYMHTQLCILQLTVCRNVNTHPQEPLRFTTPRPPPAPPCYAPGLFAVRQAARRYYGGCAGGGLRIPVRVFIHSRSVFVTPSSLARLIVQQSIAFHSCQWVSKRSPYSSPGYSLFSPQGRLSDSVHASSCFPQTTLAIHSK